MYATYCRLDELEVWEPNLVEKLKDQKQVEENGYFYNLTRKNNIVIRIPADLKDYWKRGHTEEKAKIVDPAQKKLLENKK